MHGSPRQEICDKCEIYGLTPRFSESICPKCKGETRLIDTDELRKHLDLYIPQKPLISFTFRNFKNELFES